jgi:hypothetical protein
MYRFLHKIFGAYTLKVAAKDGVRFVNILNREKVLFWGLRSGEDGFYIKASLFSCEPMIKTAASEGIKAEIVRTTGIPFVFNKYKGRYGLIAVITWDRAMITAHIKGSSFHKAQAAIAPEVVTARKMLITLCSRTHRS